MAGSTRSRTIAERGKVVVARTGLDNVAERARDVGQIPGLAVAVPQARKDAGCLEVALHAHQSNQRRNCASSAPVSSPAAVAERR